jgi:hypothetical protein
MTNPQNDPVSDVSAALARMAEQTNALQRQITRMEAVFTEQNHLVADMISASEARQRDLTDAKFVTYRTLIDSQAEKVALALDATEKAIGKAEVATTKAIDKAEISTSKAIDKEAIANADRFASVNEFRQQLNDQARSFMPRTEAVQLSDQATQRIRELAELVPGLASRQEVQLMTDRYSERIAELANRLNQQEGQLRGAQANKAGIYAALGAATALIVAIVVVLNFVTSQ